MGIINKDIYNFDETSFAMDIITITKVITQTDKWSCSSLVQSGNWEWIIIIETINASDWVLFSMIIFAEKTHCMNWFINVNLSLNWTIAVSDNDWIND